MMGAMTNKPPTHRSRRWLQFRLRSLLVLMLVAALALGWYARLRHGVLREQSALATVRRLQAQMTKPPENWIGSPLVVQSHPWWLRLNGEQELSQVTAVSFDLRSYDDGFEMESPLGDAELRVLSALPHLRSLKVPRSRISDAGLSALGSLRRLTTLDLSATAVTDRGLMHLQPLHALESLVLDRTAVTGSGLEHLQHCPRLQSLSLFTVPLQTEHVDLLNELHSLEVLRIAAPNLKRVSLHGLLNLRQLTVVLLAADVDLQLESLPKLEEVDIFLAEESRLQRLHFTELTSLTRVRIAANNTSRPPIKSEVTFRDLPKLREIAVSGTNLARPSARALAALPSVEDIVLDDNSGSFDDRDAIHLAGLARLKKLRLPPAQLTDAGLARLATIPSLRELSLFGERLTVPGMRALGELPNLTALHLSHLQASEDVGHALGQLANLELVSLSHCHLDSLTLDNSPAEPHAAFLKLKQFAARECSIGTVRIAELPRLADLTLQTRPRTIQIEDLPQLHRLDISLPREKTVEQFTLQNLPKLEWLSLQGGTDWVKVSTFAKLHGFPRLKNGIITAPPSPHGPTAGLNRWTRTTDVAP